MLKVSILVSTAIQRSLGQGVPYHTNTINTLCMAFSGLSPASFRLAKEELETLVGQFVV